MPAPRDISQLETTTAFVQPKVKHDIFRFETHIDHGSYIFVSSSASPSMLNKPLHCSLTFDMILHHPGDEFDATPQKGVVGRIVDGVRNVAGRVQKKVRDWKRKEGESQAGQIEEIQDGKPVLDVKVSFAIEALEFDVDPPKFQRNGSGGYLNDASIGEAREDQGAPIVADTGALREVSNPSSDSRGTTIQRCGTDPEVHSPEPTAAEPSEPCNRNQRFEELPARMHRGFPNPFRRDCQKRRKPKAILPLLSQPSSGITHTSTTALATLNTVHRFSLVDVDPTVGISEPEEKDVDWVINQSRRAKIEGDEGGEQGRKQAFAHGVQVRVEVLDGGKRKLIEGVCRRGVELTGARKTENGAVVLVVHRVKVVVEALGRKDMAGQLHQKYELA
ncbi:hypothetical protein HDU97_005788 [Phlyctochytrium planicorne]|nr:hypothetical protein HDU97_005788 [Phlyctochytrium planicorne]